MFRLVTALFVLTLGACAEPAVTSFDAELAERSVDCEHLREKIAALVAEARAAVAELEAEQAEQLARLDTWYQEQQDALDRRYRAAVEANWGPYVQGTVTRAEAIAGTVRDLRR